MSRHRTGGDRAGRHTARCTCPRRRRRRWPWVVAGLLLFFWVIGHFDQPPAAHSAPVVVIGHAAPAG